MDFVTATLVLIALLLLQPPQRQDKPKRPVETEAIVDRARGVAPEFAADLLLRLASSPTIPDRAWKMELIEESFVVAVGAQFPAPRSGGSHTDSRFGRHVSDARLDRLTLQVQAVEAMLPLQPIHALEVFRRIQLPELKPVPCVEIVIERPVAYYEPIPKLFAASFTAEQRRRSDDVAFVSDAIRTMRADQQIEPVAAMIQASTLHPKSGSSG